MTETNTSFDASRLDSMSADDAASLIFVMRDAGIAEADNHAIEAWLESSGEHKAAWERAVTLWNSFESEPDPLLDAMRRDALMARPVHRASYRRLSIAASVAAAIAIGAVGYWQMEWRLAVRAPQIASAAPIWNNGIGPPMTRTLGDGTQITLAPQSAIEIDYAPGRRQVKLLRGRAFFAVAHEARRPFVVSAEGVSITDIGTAFEVGSSRNELTVIVSRGRVSVRAPKEKLLEIAAGQSLRAKPGEAPNVTPTDLQGSLSWKDGFLDFRSTPLAIAIAESEAYGGAKLKVDTDVGEIRVSGRFRWGDTEKLARVLAQLYPIEIATDADGTLVLRSRS